jgi:hypothetical protein
MEGVSIFPEPVCGALRSLSELRLLARLRVSITNLKKQEERRNYSYENSSPTKIALKQSGQVAPE